MKKIHYAISVLIVACFTMSGQQLKTGEYYFDTDPGVGNGTLFTFTQADSVDVPVSFSTATLSVGFHKIYTRVKNINNVWSHSKEHLFYVYTTTTPTYSSAVQLKKGEYYFDTDPGVGNGTPFTFTQADSVDVPLSVPTGTLSVGFHKLYTRVQDVSRVWSPSSEKLFYIYDNSPPTTATPKPPVAAMEYFFDDVDYGPGQCAYLSPFTPLDSVLVNGSIVAEDPLFLTPLSVGVHKLNIRAKDLNGVWSMTKSVAFTVCNQAATSSYIYSVSGSTVTFTNNSINDYGTKWIFGDGATSTSDNTTVTHTYNNGGTLNVCLISYSGCGNDTACNLVSLNCVSPTANFSSTVNNLTVAFTNSSVGGSSYSWNFGDSKSSIDANPVHTFNASGTYTVCLTTTNGCGSHQVCFPVTVTCVAPVANYSVAINGLTATITNTSTNAANFIWNFGDATTNNIDYNPVKQYATAGTYNLKLTVSNGCGANIKQGPITINCIAPSADFNLYADGLGVELENISVNGSAWAWDFGDGTTSTFKNPPIHNFPSTGTYTVCLTATNGCGNANICHTVSVCTAPTAQFTSASVGTTANLTNTSSNASSYVWNFGDGLITNITSPSHQFAASGTHTVCLTATNVCGTNTICNNVFLFCSSGVTPSICLVTVDTTSHHNIIVWDKTGYATSDTFLVYRDTANNNYALIGSVPYDSLSEFNDTVRTLYAANGDPNVSSWRYKIAVKDSCGNVSTMSPYHQTMFIQNSLANFSWNHYQIEGQPTPIPALINYVCTRDDNSTNNWMTIQTLSASSTAYTDTQYSTFVNTASWRTKTNWNISCTSTRGAINTSRSNIKSPTSVGIKSEINNLKSKIKVYPNPATEMLNVELVMLNEKEATVVLENMLGQVVYSVNTNQQINKINTSLFANGVYLVKVKTTSGISVQKVIIE